MAHSILVVDDDPVQRRLLGASLSRMGHGVVEAENGQQAIDRLTIHTPHNIDLVLLDLVMPGMGGLDVLAKLRAEQVTVPVVVQTAQGGVETAVKAIQAGAQDFCVKPVSPERLRITVQNILSIGAMAQAVQQVRKSSAGTFTFDDMIGDSAPMQAVRKLGKRAAGSAIPVLIEGESGVGKEVIAKAIQGESERRGKSFVTVNCGALPETLAESILFGHEKGAFTGANTSHIGKFEEADGGTLFLDEVGELSADLQVKLLRAVQEGEIDPVGARKPRRVDVRLICATNRDLADQVAQGAFREDLYYRLAVFPLAVPSLRERRADIAELVRHFVARLSLEEGRCNIKAVDGEVMALLQAHNWPGNVRQLENMIFRAIVLCDGDVLKLADFPQLALVGADAKAGESAAKGAPAFSRQPAQPANALMVNAESGMQGMGADKPPLSLLDSAGALKSLDALEEDIIRNAIDHHKGRMTRVARSLGIGRSTLYRKLKEYGLSGDEEATEAPLGADANGNERNAHAAQNAA